MRPSTRVWLVLFACVLSLVPACRNRTGEPLPAEVQAAVDAVSVQLNAAAKAVAGAVEGFASVDLSGDDVFGTCPTVNFSLENNVASITLTFQDDCTNDYYGDETLGGSVAILFDANSNTFSATLHGFTVGDQTTFGSLAVQRSTGAGELRTWTGAIDFATTGVGSVQGDITLKIEPVQQTITIETASLTISEEGGATYGVEVDGLVIRPVANQSFVPEDGTVTFVIPNPDPDGPETETLTVEIAFDASSPVNGTVQVSINGGAAVEYELPGI